MLTHTHACGIDGLPLPGLFLLLLVTQAGSSLPLCAVNFWSAQVILSDPSDCVTLLRK